ncbi:hypothetical protein COT87_02200 [Candidatus Collierbacteria bacterium CG10_big_fil_rev_8_21_14_0_10_44_9]|uniref:Nudix hydrolase domain-containing protein n=1 Tax=Candidatus Collierbacteria bacterium CG10_big_fil_rev_8_21_14_0_10_44_9 TaxID=1974535 RepID=A0A2H0VKP0_9BACT|nr:MAG: hypothetical protein COT87_02200 [Candidatus Collierbacteria bacterium CG10_big_fil_rev_8_21_14_0_10_44_9]
MLNNPDEQVDIIDLHNRPVGIASKSVAHHDGLLHRIVIGELINSKGEYCFVRQAEGRQDAGQFVSPIGGHVQTGERIEDALVRECQEEVGLTPSQIKFIGSTLYNREVIGRKENHLFFVYSLTTDRSPVLNHESVEYRWFSVADIQSSLKTNPNLFGGAWHHVFQNCFPSIYAST